MKHLKFKLLIIGAAFIFFFPVVTFDEFHLDDPLHITGHEEMKHADLQSFSSLWLKPRAEAYTPLTYTVWYLASYLGRKKTTEVAGEKTQIITTFDPRVYRTLNLILYAIACVLFFSWLCAQVSSPWPAFWGALLFTTHPIHVEPIAWITGLRDLLGGVFMMACLLYYDRLCRSKDPWAPPSFKTFQTNQTVRNYFFVSFYFVLAALSKPTSFAMPIILGILGLFYYRRSFKTIFFEFTPWAFLLPVLLVQSNENKVVADIAVAKTNILERCIVALDSVSFYLYKFFMPFSLALDYGRTPPVALQSKMLFLTVPLPLVLALFLWWHRKKPWAQTIAICLGVFVAALIPMLGFKKFIFQHISTVSDRYIFFSIIGPCFFLAWVLNRHPLPKKVALSTLGVLFIFLGFLSSKQAITWSSKYQLYRHMLKINPNSWLAYNNLANSLEMKARPERALYYFKKASEHCDFAAVWENIGVLLMKMDRPKEALDAFLRCYQSNPHSPRAMSNLGVVYVSLGEKKKGRELFLQALERDPNFSPAQENLANIDKIKKLEVFKNKSDRISPL